MIRSTKLTPNRDLGLLFNHDIHHDCKLEPVLDVTYVKDLTRRLGHKIVNYVILKTEENPPKSTDYHVKSLLLTVDYLLEKHKLLFMDMGEKMLTNKPDKICESFMIVADELIIHCR